MTGFALAQRHGVASKIINQILGLCGDGAELVSAQQRNWASATFSGARHIVEILAPPTAAMQASALVDQAEPGGTAALRVELLTIVAD